MPQAQDNLIQLQRSAKNVRNPFGFDFQTTWNKEKIVLPGDGQFYSFVGPLAEHIIRRLKMAVLYRYHDEQVAKMRAQGLEKEARKYNNSNQIVNKVHELITGESDPSIKQGSVDPNQAVDIDFSVLKKDFASATTAAGKNNGGPMNISGLLDEANQAAEEKGETVRGASILGSSELEANVQADSADGMLAAQQNLASNGSDAPADEEPAGPTEAQETSPESEAEFPDLQDVEIK